MNRDLSLRVTTTPKGTSGELWYKIIKRCFPVSGQFTVGVPRAKIIRSYNMHDLIVSSIWCQVYWTGA